ncbi:hypothetical protein ABW19_dt0205145 [Dactylella cylindrospora]|nr:hypothetical protein ABW19_dt0205145 [Dactylella cylindrospora]
MPQISNSLQRTINCLYRLPIRKASPLDKFKGEIPREISPFGHFDILYVKDKFPDLQSKHPEVVARLGKAITRRRKGLYHRKLHYEALQAGAYQEPPELEPSNISPQSKEPTGLDAPVVTKSVRTLPLSDKIPQTVFTKATTFHQTPGGPSASQLDPASLLAAPSVVTSAYSAPPSTYTSQNLVVDIPPRPKDANGKEMEQFLCPYCYVVQDIRTQRQWRLTWFCKVDGHASYDTREAFLEHMQFEHNVNLGRREISTVKDLFGTPSGSKSGTCTLCLQEATSFEAHISRHLEQLALFVIPRAHFLNGEDGDGEDEGSNSSKRIVIGRMYSDRYISDVSDTERVSRDHVQHSYIWRNMGAKGSKDEREYDPDGLFAAVKNGNARLVESLIDKGANIEARNSIGGTALSMAVTQGNLHIVLELMRKSADLEARDAEDRTPLMLAVQHQSNVVAK